MRAEAAKRGPTPVELESGKYAKMPAIDRRIEPGGRSLA
jgi:hypothetical protein